MKTSVLVFCRLKRVWVGAVLLTSTLCNVSAFAETVLSKSDLRLWETVSDRAAPLEWSWADKADSATLVFSNRVTRNVSSPAPVLREEGTRRGSCSEVPVPAFGECVLDVLLSQTSGGVVVSQESATLAYVSGAGGGPITVRAMGTPERERARLQEPRVYAFDPAWLGLDGESGYDVAWPMYRPFRIIMR